MKLRSPQVLCLLRLRLLALLPLLCLLTGCLGDMPFDRSLALTDILDLPGSEDVVVIDARRVEGLGDGYHTMSLPADWKSRRAEPQVAGFPLLVPTITPEWTVHGESGSRSFLPHYAIGGERLPWQFIRGDLTLEEATLMAAERLGRGGDAYWIGAVEESGDPAIWTCPLLGARLRQPLAGRVPDPVADIEWVQVCMLEFADSRSGGRRKWERLSGEVVATGALLALYGIPIAVWFLIFD